MKQAKERKRVVILDREVEALRSDISPRQCGGFGAVDPLDTDSEKNVRALCRGRSGLGSECQPSGRPGNRETGS
jgi:hypothetical protein